MRSGSTDKLFLRRSNILPAGGESDGTVLSCNMILARNITGYPFPQAAPVQAREEIARKVFAAAEECGDFSRFDIDPRDKCFANAALPTALPPHPLPAAVPESQSAMMKN